MSGTERGTPEYGEITEVEFLGVTKRRRSAAQQSLFVTWWHTITSATPFTLGNQTVSLGRVNHTFRQHLVGGVDFSGKVNGKFAGYTTSFDPAVLVSNKD